MNTLYLLIDEKKDFALVKIGFTSNLQMRLKSYSTANPWATLHSVVHTKSHMKHELEKRLHNEITKKGYDFVISKNLFTKTEWFKISYDDPFYMEIMEKGFKAFKTTKNHKQYRAE